MKPFALTSLASSTAHSVVCISLMALFPATSLAAPDAAQVAGDLQVDGIHFSSDNSVQTKASPWGNGAQNGFDIGFMQGNVGIGTLIPSAKLDVAGTVNATSFTSSGNITTTGNIGIGTASPSVRLDVVGDANISGALTAGTYHGLNVVGDPTISGVLRLLNPANCWTDFLAPRMESAANGSLFFSIPGVINGNCNGYSYYPMLPVMTLANIGNYPAVGIGTSTPTHMLDVAGPGNFAGAVTAAGYVGIGTTTPNRQLHIVSQSPTAEISLELGGGTPNNKIWNIAAEVSPLPNLDFRVLNDAGTAATRQALTLKNNGNAVFYGNVGVGATSVTTLNNDGTASFGNNVGITVNNSNPNLNLSSTLANDFARLRLTPNGKSFWDIAAGYTDDRFNIYRLGKGDILSLQPDSATDLMVMSNGAHLTAGGAWTNASDRNVKTGFAEVDAQEVLEKVAALPITYWSYKTENSEVRHIGPMAQDFAAAFKLGSDDKSITTVDADGVALAAIKALKVENDSLRAANEAIQARLDRLEKMLQVQ